MSAMEPDSLLKVMSDPSELAAEKDETPKAIEFDWNPVSDWPAELRGLIREIGDVEHTLRALRKPDGHPGGSTETYRAAIDLLDQVLVQHREKLSAGILAHMGIPRG